LGKNKPRVVGTSKHAFSWRTSFNQSKKSNKAGENNEVGWATGRQDELEFLSQ